jgi:enoyl-CoA hydratase/carnithine racemase
MAEEKVKYREQGGIAFITINNPQKMNILDLDVYHGLFSAFKSIEEDDHVGVAIRKILSKAPLAIDLIKSSINRGVLSEGASFTIHSNKFFFQTEDMKEGVNAFLKKRNLIFCGV